MEEDYECISPTHGRFVIRAKSALDAYQKARQQGHPVPLDLIQSLRVLQTASVRAEKLEPEEGQAPRSEPHSSSDPPGLDDRTELGISDSGAKRGDIPSSQPQPAQRTQAVRRTWTNGEEVIYLTQLSLMLKAGIALPRALELAAAPFAQPARKERLDRVLQSVCGGNPLWAAFQAQQIFKPSQISAIRAAEKAGKVDEELARQATQRFKQDQMGRELRAQLTYPALVLAGMILLGASLPRLWATLWVQFAPVGDPLTRLASWISHPLYPALILLLVGGVPWIVYRSQTLRAWLLAKPPLSTILWGYARIEIAEQLSGLLQSGIHLNEALRILTSGAAHWPKLESELKNLSLDFHDSGSLAKAAQYNPLFRGLPASFLTIGEEVGDLPLLLVKANELEHMRLQAWLSGCLDLLEPLLTGFTGSVLGIVIVICLVPLLKLAQQI